MALKGLIVAAAVALGALVAAGCVLAALFEAQGFGRPRDAGVRLDYVVALGLGFAASVGVPFVLWRRLLPESVPRWAMLAAAGGAVAGAILILGIGLW